MKNIFTTSESRVNFLKGLAKLAHADSRIDANEKKFFMDAAIGLELADDQLKFIAGIINYSQSEAAGIDFSFDTKKQNLYFIREAIQLSYLDGDYSEAERQTIGAFAHISGISMESVDEIEKWVVAGINWLKSGDQILARLECI